MDAKTARREFLGLNALVNRRLRDSLESFTAEVIGMIQSQGLLERGAISSAALEEYLRPLVRSLGAKVEFILRDGMMEAAVLTFEREAAEAAAAVSFVRGPAGERVGEAIAASLAIGPWRTAAADAVAKAFSGTYGSPLSLSRRLWVLSESTEAAVNAIVLDHAMKGTDLVRVSKDLERWIVPRPGREKIWDTGNAPERLRRTVGRAPRGFQSPRTTVSYNHLRIARTELFRMQLASHQISTTAFQGMFPFPMVKGIRWNLSGSHPEPDICDVWATQDGFGLGTGVYPVENLPGGHPNCLCYTTTEFMSPSDIERAAREYMARAAGTAGKKAGSGASVLSTGFGAAAILGAFTSAIRRSGKETWGYESAEDIRSLQERVPMEERSR